MSEKTKVLELVLSLTTGGTEKLVYDLVSRLGDTQYTPVVCCLDYYGKYGDLLRNQGVTVYCLNRKPGIDYKLIPRLAEIVNDEQIKIIHAHQYSPYFYGMLSILQKRTFFHKHIPKMVYTEHGLPFPFQKDWKRRLVNPLLSFFTQEHIAISKTLRNNLAYYENFDHSRFKIIYNGIDLEKFDVPVVEGNLRNKLGISQNSYILGIVARLHHVKNHPMLLKAFQKVLVSFPDATLLIIGDGPEENALIQLTKELQIQRQTHFLGNRSDIKELLRIIDIFILPSFSEGTSVSILEAMAMKRPVVATRVGGNPEVVEDQKTGILVENENVEELTMAIEKLLKNPELRTQMGNAGRVRVQENFSQPQMVQAYCDVFAEVIS